ncbi:MAG: hypothetical protein HON90_05755 [Halobacteriovoraceae bacterium]|jgi:hypothetical protein|nr:hypothetical protein [Halobacteriovoraceae bacterium]
MTRAVKTFYFLLANFIALISLNSWALAPKQVILLNSIYDIDKYGREIYDEIGKEIYNQLGSKYSIKVIHHTGQEELYYQLNNPNNFAVFFVAHSNSSKSHIANNLIISSDRFNVLPLFHQIHPNIKWVGIVGCKAKALLNKIKHDFYMPQIFYASDSLTFHLSGLKKAIKHFVRSQKKTDRRISRLQRKKKCTSKTIKEVEFVITRLPSDTQPLRLTQRGRFLSLSSPNLKSKSVFLQVSNKNNVSLKVDIGLHPIQFKNHEIENIQITTADKSIVLKPVVLFGRTKGVTSVVYKAEGIPSEYIKTKLTKQCH